MENMENMEKTKFKFLAAGEHSLPDIKTNKDALEYLKNYGFKGDTEEEGSDFIRAEYFNYLFKGIDNFINGTEAGNGVIDRINKLEKNQKIINIETEGANTSTIAGGVVLENTPDVLFDESKTEQEKLDYLKQLEFLLIDPTKNKTLHKFSFSNFIELMKRSQWKGDKGEQGDKGEPGINGINGANGINGRDASLDDAGKVWFHQEIEAEVQKKMKTEATNLINQKVKEKLDTFKDQKIDRSELQDIADNLKETISKKIEKETTNSELLSKLGNFLFWESNEASRQIKSLIAKGIYSDSLIMNAIYGKVEEIVERKLAKREEENS